MGNNTVHPRKQMATRELQKKALELRLQGYSYPMIAAAVGRSQAYIFKLVNKGLREVTKEASEEVLELELQRLDLAEKETFRVLNNFHPVIQSGSMVRGPDGRYIQDNGPVLQAIDRLLKIAERRAKYLGLDAPTKSELSGPHGAPLDVKWEIEIVKPSEDTDAEDEASGEAPPIS